MTVKINLKKELGIAKPVEVKESNKNVRKTWVFQKEMTAVQINQAKQQKEADEAKDEDEALVMVNNMFGDMIKVQDEMITYLTDVLHLDKKNQDKLEELTFDETMELSTKVSSAILHLEAEEATEGETSLKA